PWALPYLIFIIVGFILGARGIKDNLVPTLAWLAVFSLVYVTTWIRSDSAPVSRTTDPWVLVTIILLVALSGVALLFMAAGSLLFLLPYIGAVVVLQLPRHLYMRWACVLLVGTVVFAAVSVFLNYVEISEASFGAAILVCTVFMTMMARRAIDNDRQESIRQAGRVHASQFEERSRISADLHDVLGQTLTAINVNAQVVARFAQLGKMDEGVPYLEQLQELSHDALAQMRQVVAATREADLDQELAQAAHLADAAGIVLTLSDEGHPPEGKTSQVAAHLVRESMANVVHHSGADRVWVELSPVRVSVHDNGRGSRPAAAGRSRAAAGQKTIADSQQSAHAGQRMSTGLESLEKRAEGVGTVTWGPADGGGWHVTFTVDPVDGADSPALSMVGDTIRPVSEGALS
ncbi:MAG: histidine kinase, partial [Actinomyces sp.]|nr:histidine kinase [Actinomyces sp.]